MKLFLPFFPLIKPPIQCFKVRDLQLFSAKKSPSSLITDPSIGIFWLLCKANHSNRALSTFSYWKSCNFLVLGALSSSAWNLFFVFNPDWNGGFRHTRFIACLFICHTLSLCLAPFLQSFRIQLTFDWHFRFDDTENKKQILFSFTVEIFVLIQIQIYSAIRKSNSNMQMFEIERENGSRDRKICLI